MRKYNLITQRSPETDQVPIISDDHGAIFVFIVPRAASTDIWQTAIWLTFNREGFYIGMYVPTRSITTQHLPDRKGTSKNIPCDFIFKNIVVKVVMSLNSYSVYVDGIHCYTSNEKVTMNAVALRAYFQSGSPHKQYAGLHAGLQGTLLVFEEAEKNKAETIAQFVQNGNLDDAINQYDARLGEGSDGPFDTPNDDLGQRESRLREKEKKLSEREDALKKKERDLELRSADLNGRTHSGSSGNSDPPDAEIIRLSATRAWPNAIKYVLKESGYAPVKERHDTLIKEWLEARQSRISPNSYDYYVYSLGVVWPRAVSEFTGTVELAKIREKQDEYLDLLVDSVTYPDHV